MKDTKTIYEQLGGTYREENGNLVPDVELPEQKPIGKYGKMHIGNEIAVFLAVCTSELFVNGFGVLHFLCSSVRLFHQSLIP